MQASTQVVVGKAIFLAVILMTGILTAGIENAFAVPVTFQNGTATFTQVSPSFHSTDASVNGNAFDNGWAIHPNIVDQTAVWETTTDVNAGQLDFKLHQNWGAAHLIGRFRLSVTSDDRSTFADDLETGGDVTANWTVLTSPVISGPAGLTFTTLGDNSILASGTVPNTGVYDIQFTGSFSGITGIRLEVLEDPSLPVNGPGLQPTNGNFVLSEIELDASGTPVPEPSTLLLLGTGLIGLAGYGRRKKWRT